MEPAIMGKVVVSAKIENYQDTLDLERGMMQPDQVRTIELGDALVDTGATYVSMPISMIQKLGLKKVRDRAKAPAGEFRFGFYAPVQLTVQGRDCVVNIAEVSDTYPVLIGQLPLEMLDFVIDMREHRLIGNPDHRGEHMFDLL